MFWKSKITDLEHDDVLIDIHHIFPKRWCTTRGIDAKVFNSIVNKTAISYKANRKIGGNAPSYYLPKLQSEKQVQLTDPEMNAILETHLIDPDLLRSDSFEEFYADRRKKLVALVERAIGKSGDETGAVADDETELDEQDHTDE